MTCVEAAGEHQPGRRLARAPQHDPGAVEPDDAVAAVVPRLQLHRAAAAQGGVDNGGLDGLGVVAPAGDRAELPGLHRGPYGRDRHLPGGVARVRHVRDVLVVPPVGPPLREQLRRRRQHPRRARRGRGPSRDRQPRGGGRAPGGGPAEQGPPPHLPARC